MYPEILLVFLMNNKVIEECCTDVLSISGPNEKILGLIQLSFRVLDDRGSDLVDVLWNVIYLTEFYLPYLSLMTPNMDV